MDEITVAALWEGSKAYVKNHPAEFSAEAAKAGSEEYWKAVNETYQKVIERTQPNYTVMQRAGIQRNPDEFVKTFTMFTTQRFQNYGILADAVMDYKTQSARYKAQQSAENRSEVQRAGKQLNRAVVSQVTQAAMEKLGAMGKESEVYSQLKRRLVQYDPDVLEAAQARNNGNDARREQLTRQIIREMYETMGIDQRAKADAAKREAVIDMVIGAVEQKGDTLLKGDSESVTDALEQALESVRAKDAQEELDRLLRAGKSLGSVKSKITAVCK